MRVDTSLVLCWSGVATPSHARRDTLCVRVWLRRQTGGLSAVPLYSRFSSLIPDPSLNLATPPMAYRSQVEQPADLSHVMQSMEALDISSMRPDIQEVSRPSRQLGDI